MAVLAEHGYQGVQYNAGLGQVCGSHVEEDVPVAAPAHTTVAAPAHTPVAAPAHTPVAAPALTPSCPSQELSQSEVEPESLSLSSESDDGDDGQDKCEEQSQQNCNLPPLGPPWPS